jgi:N-methylhydantoinase A/acetophenone carboxylase
MVFMEPVTERLTTEYDTFNQTVERLIETAKQDLLAEGLPVEKAAFQLELDMLYGGQVHVKRMASPQLFIRRPEDVRAVYNAFEKEFSEAFSPLIVNKPGGVYLDSFVIKMTVPTAKPQMQEYPLGETDPSASASGTRKAYWPEYGEFRETPTYTFELLTPGNVIIGPAVIEAELTTVVLPPGQRFSIDRFGLGIMEKA